MYVVRASASPVRLCTVRMSCVWVRARARPPRPCPDAVSMYRCDEGEREGGKESLLGSLEADCWPDRSLRPTIPVSRRRLTESRNLRRKRRDATSTGESDPDVVTDANRPTLDSRLWTIDRSTRNRDMPPDSPPCPAPRVTPLGIPSCRLLLPDIVVLCCCV